MRDRGRPLAQETQWRGRPECNLHRGGKQATCRFGCGGAGALEDSKQTELNVDSLTLSELQLFNSNLLEADPEVLSSPLDHP